MVKAQTPTSWRVFEFNCNCGHTGTRTLFTEGVVELQALESVYVPTSPTSPQPLRDISLAIALGVALGILLASAAAYLFPARRVAGDYPGTDQRSNPASVAIPSVTPAAQSTQEALPALGGRANQAEDWHPGATENGLNALSHLKKRPRSALLRESQTNALHTSPVC